MWNLDCLLSIDWIIFGWMVMFWSNVKDEWNLMVYFGVLDMWNGMFSLCWVCWNGLLGMEWCLHGNGMGNELLKTCKFSGNEWGQSTECTFSRLLSVDFSHQFAVLVDYSWEFLEIRGQLTDIYSQSTVWAHSRLRKAQSTTPKMQDLLEGCWAKSVDWS